jgi:hypothetical protein
VLRAGALRRWESYGRSRREYLGGVAAIRRLMRAPIGMGARFAPALGGRERALRRPPH